MKTVNIRLAAIAASGRKARSLAAETALGEKLPAGLLEALAKDVAALSVPETDNKDTSVYGLTGKQIDACRRAHRRISAIRRAVVRQTRKLEVRRLYGVGERVSTRVVRDIVHALEVLIARMDGHPDEVKAFGFGPEVLETLKAQLAEVTGADDVQEKARADRPRSTRERDAAARRVMLAVGLISDLGAFTFADDDTKRIAFEGLISRVGRPAQTNSSSRTQAETETPAPPAEGAPAAT